MPRGDAESCWLMARSGSMATATCQLKNGLFGCGADRVGMCVYCGRLFCARHGVLQEDGSEVCARKECEAKRVELVVHLAYKDAVLDRNLTRMCGLETCDKAIEAQCARCKGYFCLGHLDAREDLVEDDGVKLPRMVRMCRHCHQRRSIWSKA